MHVQPFSLVTRKRPVFRQERAVSLQHEARIPVIKRVVDQFAHSNASARRAGILAREPLRGHAFCCELAASALKMTVHRLQWKALPDARTGHFRPPAPPQSWSFCPQSGSVQGATACPGRRAPCKTVQAACKFRRPRNRCAGCQDAFLGRPANPSKVCRGGCLSTWDAALDVKNNRVTGQPIPNDRGYRLWQSEGNSTPLPCQRRSDAPTAAGKGSRNASSGPRPRAGIARRRRHCASGRGAPCCPQGICAFVVGNLKFYGDAAL